jgi:hypothetical protein
VIVSTGTSAGLRRQLSSENTDSAVRIQSINRDNALREQEGSQQPQRLLMKHLGNFSQCREHPSAMALKSALRSSGGVLKQTSLLLFVLLQPIVPSRRMSHLKLFPLR